MAGIGFELRKLFRKEGLLNNLRAYAYSTMTTVGPIILCTALIIILQLLMKSFNASHGEWELYIATVSYSFIFSIVITSGISLVITRYVSDCLYKKDYRKLMSSYYGELSIVIPTASILAVLFLSNVNANLSYKICAYFFFVFLVIIWIQGVYLSALKDYSRIVRGFLVGAILAILVAWMSMGYFSLSPLVSALLGLDIGFFATCLLTGLHFQQKFPKADKSYYYEFLKYFRKFPLLFFSGCFVYSGIYLHNFVYWFSEDGQIINSVFHVYMFYDVPVFYAFITVIPTLIAFVVSVETSFFEKFKYYYLNVLNEGTIQDIENSKKQMQRTLLKEISFLMEVQLLFTVFSIGIGIIFLPQIGFTMQQLDLFIILSLAYYLFIIMFSFIHILMYFDDQKGVLLIGLIFFILNIACTLITKKLGFDGFGMFVASIISLVFVILRLSYVLRNIDYYTFCAQPISNTPKKRENRRKGMKKSVLVMVVALSFLITACTNSALNSVPTEKISTSKEVAASGLNYETIDDKRIYERDQDDTLKALYITVLPKEDDSVKFDWYELNRQVDKSLGQKLEVIVQEGLPDGAGPVSGMFQYGTSIANASIEVRGNSAWSREQKSYKLKLYADAGLYMDQRNINLNKHIDDLSRLRNKLSFDLMEKIPDITSLRTQFIQVYVKDLSMGQSQAAYENYGLYTHVEQPNKKFLKAHLLDSNGYLYKVKFFEYFRYPDKLKSTNDPTYDKAVFEELLEIKGREEHEKLIEMLDAVNDYNIPIEETIEKYFDLDNFLTWTAINILMDNTDTEANNFFLYSPLNVNKWYILPWDYDGGWELSRQMNFAYPYQMGISNYWGMLIHNRYFRNEENVQKLTEKIEEIYAKYINEDTVTAQLDKYISIVKPFVNSNPDIGYLPDLVTNYDEDIQRIINTPKHSLERYYTDLQKPKPFFLGEVEQDNSKLYFNWDVSFDLQDDDLTYELTIAKDKQMTQIIHQNSELKDIQYSIPKLAEGYYYWKVTVIDSEGNRQENFEVYHDSEDEVYYGIKYFEVY